MVNIDAQLENADWTKHSWDLGINSIPEFLVYMNFDKKKIKSFMTLPVYLWNKDKIGWMKDIKRLV